MKYNIYCNKKIIAQFMDEDMRDCCFNLLKEYYPVHQFYKVNHEENKNVKNSV